MPAAVFRAADVSDIGWRVCSCYFPREFQLVGCCGLVQACLNSPVCCAVPLSTNTLLGMNQCADETPGERPGNTSLLLCFLSSRLSFPEHSSSMQVHVCAVSLRAFSFGAFQASTWLTSAMSRFPFIRSSGEVWAVSCNGSQAFISRGRAKGSWTPWIPLNEKLSASSRD